MTAVSDRFLSFVRRIVPVDSPIRRRWRAYRALRLTQSPRGRHLLAVFAEIYSEAFFVQIGSNDGVKLDPLRAHIYSARWRGILIEPVPFLFAALQKNYAACSERLIFENVAIADHDGVLPFYHLAPVADAKAEGLPSWYDALGSFRREVIAAHVSVIPDIEKRILRRDVPAITFATLCQRNGVATVDLLHTDTEGYDFELLKSIDFTRFRPRVLIYEHIHLSGADRQAAVAYLERHGYECMPDGMDTWCLNVRDAGPRDAPLLKIWREMSHP